MQVIQKLTVVSNPTRFFEVGTEVNNREIIEIKQVGDDNISEFWVIDENEQIIASIENCPVIVEWQNIAEHDQKENDPRVRVSSGAKI
ncbi:hypothetical protein JJQ72_02090 [Paenibacillus sp. F411]|uniref:hypothetical protein n=1 Tax=Paenibacillus sp. F411 TaxID=2820239 RepID=UPI001AAFAA73|nr:hypothetical protein [Paenibacillus sp. F411]MBO2942775.1 hypothetical protein [Paenibacillus sp. F411]